MKDRNRFLYLLIFALPYVVLLVFGVPNLLGAYPLATVALFAISMCLVASIIFVVEAHVLTKTREERWFVIFSLILGVIINIILGTQLTELVALSNDVLGRLAIFVALGVFVSISSLVRIALREDPIEEKFQAPPPETQ